MQSTNKYGESESPCLRPLPTWVAEPIPKDSRFPVSDTTHNKLNPLRVKVKVYEDFFKELPRNDELAYNDF